VSIVLASFSTPPGPQAGYVFPLALHVPLERVVACVFQLSVPASVGNPTDTLDAYLQANLDDDLPDNQKTWDDFAHFAQVKVSDPSTQPTPKIQVANLSLIDVPSALHNLRDAGLAAGQAVQGRPGQNWRLKCVTAGALTVTFGVVLRWAYSVL